MSRLIDADALLQVVGEMPLDWEYGAAVSDICDIIKNTPTINLEDLRPRGLWIHVINNLYGCSECGMRETMSPKKLKNYCPTCGARMEDDP